ncbi:MAG: methyltransferase domain-containing protein [Verrucomicrobia bacterium]|nr:methyltransferase domain-containing protein [Verrucomicrobiota bacterium]
MGADGQELNTADALAWYDTHAREVVERHETLNPAAVNAWLEPFLPPAGGLVADVGAGAGRDAVWLAGKGYEVVAVEPSVEMRRQAEQLGRTQSGRIRWINDRLPGLEELHRSGLTFDFIMVNAVWHHVPPAQRERAFRKLVTLLKPTGALAITLKRGEERGSSITADAGQEHREIRFPVSVEELEKLAREHGAYVAHAGKAPDQMNREGVSWEQILIRLPDDGTGALPLLRHIILENSKSSTYKLALLRVLARIANSSLGLVRADEDEFVQVPLGLVGLYWLRQFKPLLAANLPQMPSHEQPLEGLGFVRRAYREIQGVSHLDLRVAARFEGATAKWVHEAVKNVVDNLKVMPIKYTSYPDHRRVFGVTAPGKGRPRLVTGLELDGDYLSGFGYLRVPTNIWKALTRFNIWIEPALIAEWVRIMKGYAAGQDRQIPEETYAQAMRWSDPQRDTEFARRIALERLQEAPLFCVWSGKRLTPQNLDIDHCFPWSAWPCDDLWNLLPADRKVNQRDKSDRVPSADQLRVSRDPILQWWEDAYLAHSSEVVAHRFLNEAAASLPGVSGLSGADEVYDGVTLQRIRLSHDQQIPEWPHKR